MRLFFHKAIDFVLNTFKYFIYLYYVRDIYVLQVYRLSSFV